MGLFTVDFIDFFKELSQNNNKKWFDQNRNRYEESVKTPFHYFVERKIKKIQADDPGVKITPAESIFRINRDLRFSRDKTPYKTQMSALISRTGKKDKSFPGIFFSMGAANIRSRYLKARPPGKSHLQAVGVSEKRGDETLNADNVILHLDQEKSKKDKPPKLIYYV